MLITFYTVPVLFLNNTGYLGQLNKIEEQLINVDVKIFNDIKILLNNNYNKYNYISFEYNSIKYFYYLTTINYYNYEKDYFNYHIDILRTIKENNLSNINVIVDKYSSNLFENDDINNINNLKFQERQTLNIPKTKVLSEDRIELISEPNIYMKDLRWVYIWLKPTKTETISDGVQTHSYDYYYTRRVGKIKYININNLQNIQLEPSHPAYNNRYYFVDYEYSWTKSINWWDLYTEDYKIFYHITAIINGKLKLVKTNSKPIVTCKYYLYDTPIVNNDINSNLKCIVFPTKALSTENYEHWDLTNFLQTLSSYENNILPNIVDIKVSNMVPDNILNTILPNNSVINKTYYIKFSNLEEMKFVHDINVRTYDTISEMNPNTPGYEMVNAKLKDTFVPFLINKPQKFQKLYTDKKELTLEHLLKKLNDKKYNLLFNQIKLCNIETQQILNISHLKENNYNTLKFFEDVYPGINNSVIGFVNDENNEIYTISQDPNVLFDLNDNSLSYYTNKYDEYVSNNKNFLKQADLQRKTALQTEILTSLTGMASQGIQGGGVSVSGRPIMGSTIAMTAVPQSIGKITNSFIRYQTDKQQMMWQIDNLKSAPGFYKMAGSSLLFKLNFNSSPFWIDILTVNDYDKNIFNDLIKEIGYEYHRQKYSLIHILNNIKSGKNYLEATISETIDSEINYKYLNLINILKEHLERGISIYV